MSSFFPHRRPWCCLAITIVALGCQKAEKIETYTVAKEVAPAAPSTVTSAQVNAPAQAPASTVPTDRMLAAILPDGQRAWFFKVVGPLAAVDANAEKISEFFAGIRPAGDQPLPTWKLPDGWNQRPGNAMRAATIVIPADKPLELTVTSLGWTGSPDDLLRNVNRWRGQMRLPEINQQQLSTTSSELKAGDATMTIVDLKGNFQNTMTPPFAGAGGPFAPPQAGGGLPPVKPGADLPAGHPPVDNAPLAAGAPAAAAPGATPKFNAPAGWKAVDLPPGSMRKASFLITDGTQQANVGLIDFSTQEGPMIADPLANVNRWRGEVGLPPLPADQLAAATETVEVDGQKATFSAMIPDAAEPSQSQNSRATLAAIVPHADRVWFIKLTGDRNLVAAEQERFKDFLKSVRFGDGRGATNGN